MSSGEPSQFPLVGESPALHLINTLRRMPDGEVELLTDPAALEAWIRLQPERLPQPERAITDADLREVRVIRKQIFSAIGQAREGSPPSAEVLHALTEAQHDAATYRKLGWDGAGVTATGRRTGIYIRRLIAELASAATDLLIDPSITTVRQCDGLGCVIFFLPAHPRRRWCSTACGNRVRVARYYQRHKQG